MLQTIELLTHLWWPSLALLALTMVFVAFRERTHAFRVALITIVVSAVPTAAALVVALLFLAAPQVLMEWPDPTEQPRIQAEAAATWFSGALQHAIPLVAAGAILRFALRARPNSV